MIEKDHNPESNRLSTGVTVEQLEGAVRRSGYPLQRVVAEELLANFEVTEEWPYIDRESKEHRTLDVFAFRRLEGSSVLWLSAALLVECKRSDLPYVFFETAVSKIPHDFPPVAGLQGNKPNLTVVGTGTREVPVSEFLRLADFSFISQGPPVCTSFARAERKGKELDISGSVPFNSIILPLVSALQHFIEQQKSVGSRNVPSACLTIPVCVVDGPMVLIQGGPEAPRLAMCPWIRVVRQEAIQERHWISWRNYVVDFVHRAYLTDFIERHFLPFLGQFAERALGVEHCLRIGRASVPDFDDWTFQDLKP